MLTFPGEVTVSQPEPQSTHRLQHLHSMLGVTSSPDVSDFGVKDVGSVLW